MLIILVEKKIFFDMDGTIEDLYAVDGWLEMLRANNPYPYEHAKPMLNMAVFARLLHKAQRLGFKIVIVSWLSKVPNEEYDKAVTQAKIEWLRSHLPSVVWDEIHIVPHGTPKHELSGGWLFDDEQLNRENWGECGLTPNEILPFLRGLQ